MATLLSNRAACSIRFSPPDGDAAVADATRALELAPGYRKALLRRARGYIEQASSFRDPDRAARALDAAAADVSEFRKSAALTKPVAEILAAIRRRADILQRATHHEFYLDSLRGAAAAPSRTLGAVAVKAIRRVMHALTQTTKSTARAILDASFFPRILVDMCSGGPAAVLGIDAQLEAAQALSTYAKVSAGAGVNITVSLHLSETKHQQSDLSTLLSHAETLQNDAELGNDPKKLLLLKRLLHTTTRLSQHPLARDAARSNALRRLFALAAPDAKHTTTQMTTQSDIENSVVSAALGAVAGCAESSAATLETSRKLMMSYLVNNRNTTTTRPGIRASLLHAVLVCTSGNAPPSSHNDTHKAPVRRTPRQYWQGSDVKSKAFAREWAACIAEKLFSGEPRAVVASCRALSCLLQANPPLGLFVLTFSPGGTKNPQPAILQALTNFAGHGPAPVKLLALEALALASQDKIVRECVERGGVLPKFVQLLGVGDDRVRCHAVVAMAKQVAISEPARKLLLQQDNKLINTACDILNTSKSGDGTTLSLAVEALVFLSLVGSAKRAIVGPERGFTGAMHALATSRDRAVRFGFVNILANLTRSAKDREREYNEQLAKLRRAASKGLGPDKSAEMAKIAGSPELIEDVTHTLVRAGAVRALQACVAVCRAEAKNDDPKLTAANSKDDDEQALRGMPIPMIQSIAKCLVKMASDRRNRGLLVQQRGMRVLDELYALGAERMDAAGGVDSKKGMWREDCAVALARIAVSTNPNHYPSGAVYSVVRPLVWLFSNASHELYQFEAGLGLTNIASVGEELRNTLVAHGAWSEAMNLLASENERVQRVGVELLSNLVVCSKTFERLAQDGDQDIKLFLMFAQSDDLHTRRAAAGALAMMCQEPRIAERVARLDGVVKLSLISRVAKDQALLERLRVALEFLQQVRTMPTSGGAEGKD